MMIVGLTGGTGSGKSTVASILSEMGAKVIDADMVAREVVQKGEKALEDIVEYFGQEILLDNGTLNRKKLGSIVFANKDKLKMLNRIVHKHITDRIKRQLEIEEQKGAYNMIVVDAALLIESSLYKLCDVVWVVTANRETRLRRIMGRDTISAEDAHNRIHSQMTEEEMLKYATAVIKNDRDMDYIKDQISELMKTNGIE